MIRRGLHHNAPAGAAKGEAARFVVPLKVLAKNKSSQRIPNANLKNVVNDEVEFSRCDINYFISGEIIPNTSTFAERNVCKKQKTKFHLLQSFEKNFSSAPFIRIVKKLLMNNLGLHNSSNIPRLDEIQEYLEQINLDFQCNFPLLPMIYGLRNWYASSQALTNEKLMNILLPHRGCSKVMKMPIRHQNYVGDVISTTVSSNSVVRTSVPVLDIMDEKRKNRSDLSLLCVFTENQDFEKTTINLNTSRANEDIKMILSITWNITVADNVITMSDENNQHIRIFFSKPLKVTIDYDGSYLKPNNKYNFSKPLEPEDTMKTKSTQNSQVEKGKLSHNMFITNNTKHPEKSNIMETHRSTEKDTLVEKGVNQLLPLQRHLLVNFLEEKKKSQLLVRKARSLQSDLRKQNIKLHSLANLEHLAQQEDFKNRLLCFRSLLNSLLINQKNILELNHHGKANNAAITAVKKKNEELANVKCETSVKLSNHMQCLPIPKWDKNDFSTALFKDNAYLVNESNQKDKQKSTHRKMKSITAFKRVNVRQIVLSVFRNFFHFYSLLGGHLKSGAVITKSNSNYWLVVSGVITDSHTLILAEDLFTSVAGRKIVLNIYDYLKFLIAFARRKRIIVADLVQRMTVSTKVILQENCEHTSPKRERMRMANIPEKDIGSVRSQSLPDLKIVI